MAKYRRNMAARAAHTAERAARAAALVDSAALRAALEQSIAAEVDALAAAQHLRTADARVLASAMGAMQLLEEYDANLLEWAMLTLREAEVSRAAAIAARAAADARSKGSTAEADVENRVALKRLRRNAAIADALMRIKIVAPEIDGNARYGQYLAYIHGGLDSPGLGRHYASGSYTDGQHKRRSPDLQGCPRELRRLLAALHCHDLDFVNSLPTVASQLDRLGLCDAVHLVQLKHYVCNRRAWFDAIIGYHNIQARPGDDDTPEGLAKNLIVRILHGGDYATWVKDNGLCDAGAAEGYGLAQVRALQAQIRQAHVEVITSMQATHPEWTTRILAAKRIKKARGQDIAAMSPWHRDNLERKAMGAVFAVILQEHEDRCLRTAVQVLHDGGWLVHSLQQDGMLAETTPAAEPLATLLPRAHAAMYASHNLQMEMIEKPFHLKSRDDPAILEIMRQLNQPKTDDELPARPELRRVSGTRIRPTAEESFRALRTDADAARRRAAALALTSTEATALGNAALRRATYTQDQVEAAEGMRVEADARAERDDASDAELDEDGAEPSASDGARLDGRPPAARRHRPTDQGAAPPADPMVVDETTTDDEGARAQPVTHALAAPSRGEARGAPPPPHNSGGAPTPMAVDTVEPQGAATMRASDEMQQTTIGGDSDGDGSDRPRQKKIRRRSRPGRCKAHRMQLTRRDDGNGDDGD